MTRRVVAGALMIHGLLHAAPGLWALELAPAWAVVPIWWTAMTGYCASAFGLLGVAGLRRVWQHLAVVATMASIALMLLFGNAAFAAGLVIDAFLLVAALRWGSAVPEPPTGHVRAPWLRRSGAAAAAALLLHVSAAVTLHPWHMRWGATEADLYVPLPGDDLQPASHYRMDHVVTVRAPADAVWPWVAQIGQDRAGFYSYDRLERLVGAQIRNADVIRPEWQRRSAGDLVRAVPPGYLGGIFGRDLGWRVARIDSGRAMVLRNWGAFVVRPVDDSTSRLHIRLRGDGRPSVLGTVLGPFNLLVFEPVHFLMERGMLLGIKARAERSFR